MRVEKRKSIFIHKSKAMKLVDLNGKVAAKILKKNPKKPKNENVHFKFVKIHVKMIKEQFRFK